MLYIGTRKMKRAYLGNKVVKHIYLGETELYGDYAAVTFNFDGVTTTASNKVMIGDSYTVPLSAASGKQVLPSTVKVMMGTTDVTDSTYDWVNNTINIPNVTGSVTITGEAAAIPDTYVPVMWIEGTRHVGNKGTFTTPYYPKNTTKIEMSCAPQQYGNYATVFGIKSGLVGDTRYQFQAKYATNEMTAFAFGNNAAGRDGNNRIAIGNARQLIVVNGNSVTYTNRSGNRYTASVNSSKATPWTSSNQLQIMGSRENSVTTYWSKTRMWRCKIGEENTWLYDYIPVKKVSDNSIGVYDIINGTFIVGDETMETTYKGRGGTLTNCSATLLSGATTGTNALARVGSTWSCNFAPSSGYTFNSDDAVFQVTINNEDVTSDVAVYDSTTDSWTVTLVAHWNDSISITGTAQADPNAVQSVSNPTSINNIDNPNDNEEEMI